MINWIKKNRKFLSIKAIEEELKMPSTTLSKALNDKQTLPKKWERDLNKFVNKLKED